MNKFVTTLTQAVEHWKYIGSDEYNIPLEAVNINTTKYIYIAFIDIHLPNANAFLGDGNREENFKVFFLLHREVNSRKLEFVNKKKNTSKS